MRQPVTISREENGQYRVQGLLAQGTLFYSFLDVFHYACRLARWGA